MRLLVALVGGCLVCGTVRFVVCVLRMIVNSVVYDT